METFRISFVCTGNRFRSPLAAAFVERLTAGLPVEVDSYGTLRLDGAPALPEALEIASSCDLSLAKHSTRCVASSSLADADLVLGFEPDHVHEAVVEAGAVREKAFLLQEFVALAAPGQARSDESPVTHARGVVAAAARGRRESRPSARALRDPFGGPWKVYRQSAADVRELCLALVEVLFGRRGDLPPVPARERRRRLFPQLSLRARSGERSV